MIPVYYFDKMPDQLPTDDACYIVSKYIYLKKKTGLIDSMVKVNSINMGDELPEFARMKLPKIKAAVFGKVVGFFKMVFGEYRSESGVILNLKSHPQKPNLKKIEYTIPHQKVSGAHCKYAIVVDPSYLNCGTIHCHSDFGAFHSGTDENDERYFDGLHITVGHINQDEVSIAACIVVNGKRVKVNPCDYIEGIVESEGYIVGKTKFYQIINPDTIINDKKDMKYATRAYSPPTNIIATTGGQVQTEFDWDNWYKMGKNTTAKNTCEECVFKEEKIDSILDDIVFDDDEQNNMLSDDINPCLDLFDEYDKELFERDSRPLFGVGDTDEDGIVRHDNYITMAEYRVAKAQKLNKSIKCDCGATFFVADPEKTSPCPKCEQVWPARSYSMTQFLKDRRQKETEPSDEIVTVTFETSGL